MTPSIAWKHSFFPFLVTRNKSKIGDNRMLYRADASFLLTWNEIAWLWLPMMDCATFVCRRENLAWNAQFRYTRRNGWNSNEIHRCLSSLLASEFIFKYRKKGAATTTKETHSLSQKAKQRLTRRVNEQKWNRFRLLGRAPMGNVQVWGGN